MKKFLLAGLVASPINSCFAMDSALVSAFKDMDYVSFTIHNENQHFTIKGTPGQKGQIIFPVAYQKKEHVFQDDFKCEQKKPYEVFFFDFVQDDGINGSLGIASLARLKDVNSITGPNGNIYTKVTVDNSLAAECGSFFCHSDVQTSDLFKFKVSSYSRFRLAFGFVSLGVSFSAYPFYITYRKNDERLSDGPLRLSMKFFTKSDFKKYTIGHDQKGDTNFIYHIASNGQLTFSDAQGNPLNMADIFDFANRNKIKAAPVNNALTAGSANNNTATTQNTSVANNNNNNTESIFTNYAALAALSTATVGFFGIAFFMKK